IELPLRRYWQHVSAWRSHTVTSMNSVSSRRSPSRPVHDRLVAMRSSVTAVPLGILRSSGSNVRRPIRNTLFKSGIAWFLSRPRIHRSLASGPQLFRSRKTGPTPPARAGNGMPRFCQSLDHKVNGCSLACKLKLRILPGIRREPAKPDKELARSLVAAAPARAFVHLVVASSSLFRLGVGRGGHGLIDELNFQLGMHLEDELSQDQVAKMAVSNDILELRAVGLEVSQKIRRLLVAADRVRQPALIPLATGHDLRIVLGQDVMHVLDAIVPGRRGLGAVEQKHPLVGVGWQDLVPPMFGLAIATEYWQL